MASIVRAKSGLIFEDRFDGNVLESPWVVTPSSSVAQLANGQLRLGDNINSIASRAMVDIPDGIFTFYAKYKYVPYHGVFSAGSTLFKGEFEYLELQEYDHPSIPNTSDYQYFKISRIIDDNYEFFGSKDGKVWTFVGTAAFTQPGKIGFYIRGNGYIDVEHMSICRGDIIRLYGIPANTKVDLFEYDPITQVSTLYSSQINNNIHTVIEFDLKPDFMGYFTGYAWSSYWNEWRAYASSTTDILHNGDEYVYELNLKTEICCCDTISWTEISHGIPVELGEFESDVIKKRLRITNIDSIVIGTLQVSVLQKGYNQGYRHVKIAQSLDGALLSTYGEFIFVSDLLNNGFIEVTLLIERDPNFLYDANSEFIIDLKGW